MMCSKPFRYGVEEFGCGQCLPCRMNRQRLWQGRLMLEAQKHESSLFCTLTYDEENYPADGNVSVREMQLFLKRLRSLVYPDKLRYFVVGEYGESTWRAHYHAALFGVRDADAIGKAWEKGFVHVGLLERESAGYIAKYTLKRLTREGDPALRGHAPEFARMSLRPGIGATAVEDIAKALVTADGEILGGGQVRTFKSGGGTYTLGRYLKGKLDERIGSGVTRVYQRMVDASVRADRLRTVAERDAEEVKRKQVGKQALARARIAKSKGRL